MIESRSRNVRLTLIIVALTVAAVTGCKKQEPIADLAQAKKVMNSLFRAEQDHRASHGNYWRGKPGKLSRDDAVKVLGVDLGDAPGFDFTIEPPDSGMDPVLRVTARGSGEHASVFLTCVQEATAKEPSCKDSSSA